MSRLYGDAHRALQASFNTTELADRIEQVALQTRIEGADQEFIETRDMFFLSTADDRGRPTVSYKGGDPGFIKVINPTTIAFPSYDGNGMFLSMGNLSANPEVGLLFLDFERPQRLRLQGRARVDRDDPLMVVYEGADLVVRVDVSEIWVNCPRYLHQYKKLSPSRFVPRAGKNTPIALWKRIDAMQDVQGEADQALAETSGLITAQEYAQQLAQGKGDSSDDNR